MNVGGSYSAVCSTSNFGQLPTAALASFRRCCGARRFPPRSWHFRIAPSTITISKLRRSAARTKVAARLLSGIVAKSSQRSMRTVYGYGRAGAGSAEQDRVADAGQVRRFGHAALTLFFNM